MKIKRVSRRFLPYLLIMLVAIVLLWPQLRSHAFVSGYDYYFHMSRTYETAMQIKTGHFSYFLSLFSWNHNARIVNALYGPLGGYASGLILLLAHSWLHWELIMSFIALVLAGSTMYSLDHYWRINRYVNFTLSVLYMLSEPISDYVFNQMFAGFGAALLPLLVLLMSEIMTKEDVQPVKFALVLVLIVEIHLMTFILSMILVVTGLLIAIYSAHHTRYQLFKHLCEGTGLMLILSFNVWDSILEVFGSNFHHIIPTFPGTSLGNESYSAILNTYPKASLLQSPSLIGMGVAVLIMITIGWWLITCRHLNWVTNVLMMLGLFSIWVASGYFPWSFVQRYAYSVTTLVQFPKRFLPLGLILIYLVFGIISSKYLKHNNGRKLSRNVILILLLCLIGWGWQNNYETYLSYIRIYNSSQVINWHHYVNMQWQTKRTSNQLRNSLKDDRPGQFLSTVDNPVPDYLPTSITYRQPSQYGRLNPQDKYQRVYYQRIHFKFRTLGHGRELITLPSKNPQTKIIPFAKYAHTRAVLNHHLIKPKVNQVGAMQLHLRTGNNHLLLQYQPSLWFRVGMIVSILMWLWILSCVIYHRFTK